MNQRLLLTALMSGLCLTACSDPAPPAEAPAQPPAAISAENQGVLSERQRETYNAANQVSTLLEDADAERRRQLEALEK